MRKTIQTILLCCIAVASYAVELNYKWVAGSTYHILMKAQDDVSTSINMMGISQAMKETYYTNTTLRLNINTVNSEGTGNGFLTIEKFEITNSKNMKVASLSSIPANALIAEVSVDKKGHFTFYKEVYVLVTSQGNILVSSKIENNGNGASGSATIGEQKVSVYAKYDAKTGTLKAGYTEQSVSTPKQETINIKQEDNKIDILPYKVLDMLELPEGDTKVNDQHKVQSGYYTTTVTTNDITATNVKMNINMITDKKASAGASKASGSTTDSVGNKNNMNMDMSGVDMSDFNEQMNTPMETGITGVNQTPADMMPTMTANIDLNFNIGKGMFDNITGKITTIQNTMGMEIKGNSVITLSMIQQDPTQGSKTTTIATTPKTKTTPKKKTTNTATKKK